MPAAPGSLPAASSASCGNAAPGQPRQPVEAHAGVASVGLHGPAVGQQVRAYPGVALGICGRLGQARLEWRGRASHHADHAPAQPTSASRRHLRVGPAHHHGGAQRQPQSGIPELTDDRCGISQWRQHSRCQAEFVEQIGSPAASPDVEELSRRGHRWLTDALAAEAPQRPVVHEQHGPGAPPPLGCRLLLIEQLGQGQLRGRPVPGDVIEAVRPDGVTHPVELRGTAPVRIDHPVSDLDLLIEEHIALPQRGGGDGSVLGGGSAGGSYRLTHGRRSGDPPGARLELGSAGAGCDVSVARCAVITTPVSTSATQALTAPPPKSNPATRDISSCRNPCPGPQGRGSSPCIRAASRCRCRPAARPGSWPSRPIPGSWRAGRPDRACSRPAGSRDA